MNYIEAPNMANDSILNPQIFLAGGITGCPDWQREMRDLLVNVDATLCSPRRADFPINDPSASQSQIEWEHTHLAKADAILFWFPCETLCPIVLFELGAWAYAGSKPLFVGVHPDYGRRQDVKIQLRLQRPEIEVVTSLQDLASQVAHWCAPPMTEEEERESATYGDYYRAIDQEES